jgi:hypothetical protein
MSIFNNNLLAGAAAQGGTTPVHTIDQSIRFNGVDTPQLIRTPSSSGNLDKWTFSCWVKRGKLGQSGGGGSHQLLLSAGNDVNNFTFFGFRDSGSLPSGGVAESLNLVAFVGGSTIFELSTTQVFRDPSAWYHIVGVYDSGNSVSSERCRVYINGSRITAFNVETYPSQNQDSDVNESGAVQRVGALNLGTNKGHLDGYLAEIVLIDGQALDPSSFGEYNSSGIWVPKDVSDLTFGTNGFYLKGDDANNLGKDSSGNDNDFANSLHTFEPSESNGSLSNGNLTTSFASVTNFRGGRGFVGKSSGKWYAEVTIDNRGASGGSGRSSVGITRAASFGSDTSTNAARDSVGAFTYSREGAKEQGTGSGVTSTSTGYASFSNGDVIGVALNMDDGEVYFYKNGTAQDSGTAAFTGLGSNTYDLIAIGFGGFQSTVNFGATAFSHTPPTGYGAWDTGSSALLPNDQVADSPTNNFGVMNPLADYYANHTFKNGNLELLTSTTTNQYTYSINNIGMSSGKWYAEMYVGSIAGQCLIGISDRQSQSGTHYLGGQSYEYSYYSYNGKSINGGTQSTYGNTYTTSDIIGIALDLDNSKLYFSKNGTFQNSGDPTSGASGTGAVSITAVGSTQNGHYFFAVGDYSNSGQITVYWNFGQEGTFAGNVTAGGNSDGNGIGNFKYSVPSGYLALCTKNLGS